MPKAKKFRGLTDPIMRDPARRERMREQQRDAVQEVLDFQLDELRRARDVTQGELANTLGVRQPNVSRLEHADDPKLSTLRAYIEALGGRLELIAVFDGERFPLAM